MNFELKPSKEKSERKSGIESRMNINTKLSQLSGNYHELLRYTNADKPTRGSTVDDDGNVDNVYNVVHISRRFFAVVSLILLRIVSHVKCICLVTAAHRTSVCGNGETTTPRPNKNETLGSIR
uniref:Uncharacterized protein n=1 Tax=Glossina brevipalpis TaxID=37001 RepID=A0A1A9X1R5_9MUSC